MCRRLPSQAWKAPPGRVLNLFRSQPTASLPRLRRVYAIGDVHGRMDLLRRLYAIIAEDDASRPPANTEIILLGDLVDRGPESAAVVRFAMHEQPAFAQLGTLKGNHEAIMVSALEGDEAVFGHWLRFGGGDTLESFGVDAALVEAGDVPALMKAAAAAVPAPVRHWLATLPLSRRVGDYLFVHAGIRPGVAPEEQTEQDLLWIREPFLGSAADHGMVVVHGHTVSPRPEKRANRIGIDTGAYVTSRLTALALEGDRRWFLST
jgi:serine/threonine protein phosphatase 1